MSNMVVQTNVLALNSHRNMKNVGTIQSKASQRLSSGYKINSAADDAAGLAISEKMRAQIRGLDMASKNAQDGISLVQTAEGGLQEVDNMIQRIRELCVQGANDTNTGLSEESNTDRTKIRAEIDQLADEIGSMGTRVKFNNKVLLNGSFKGDFQVGANASEKISVDLTTTGTEIKLTDIQAALKSTALIGATGTDDTFEKFTAAISTVDGELTKVTSARAYLGAVQNRLEYTGKSLDISSENLSASESRIRDTDMAKEMMNLTKANVLQQASVSMLAQANQAPQSLLSLLR